jgi:hypothetical protein
MAYLTQAMHHPVQQIQAVRLRDMREADRHTETGAETCHVPRHLERELPKYLERGLLRHSDIDNLLILATALPPPPVPLPSIILPTA